MQCAQSHHPKKYTFTRTLVKVETFALKHIQLTAGMGPFHARNRTVYPHAKPWLTYNINVRDAITVQGGESEQLIDHRAQLCVIQVLSVQGHAPQVITQLQNTLHV